MIPLAVFGSVAIGVFLLLFANRKASENPYIVVLQCRNTDAEQQAVSYLSQHTKKMVIKSKTARAGYIELNYEVRLRDEQTGFITELSGLNGVESAVLVSYNGDYLS